jgi:D-glycero-D-manno-heptose 1,7-bisphosphate phosphatase
VLKTFKILIMKKLAIFDKDGTLVKPKSGSTFVQDPEDQILLPGVSKGIAEMAANGWSFAIASNQGGVEAGFKTLDDAIAEMRFCINLVFGWQKGANISSYFCPDDGATCWRVKGPSDYFPAQEVTKWEGTDSYRKPGAGMIQQIEREQGYGSSNLMLKISLRDYLFVGDRPEDQQAAQNAGVSFQWADDWRKKYVQP